MESLLFLAHRIPYPPNKGDKIRSYNLLKFLSQHFKIYLGTFIDDPQDLAHVQHLQTMCEASYFININDHIAKCQSLKGLIKRTPLSVEYYSSGSMQLWVDEVIESKGITKVFLFSSPMAQFLKKHSKKYIVMDFIDIDSNKWQHYAKQSRGLMNLIYHRESRLLSRYEKDVAQMSQVSLFASAAESEEFRKTSQIDSAYTLSNGVDLDYFDPNLKYENPYPADQKILVFTGTMNYRINIDAVLWFAETVFPKLNATNRAISFYIVGAKPDKKVRALENIANIHVTGQVDDIRPFLKFATIALAPMQVVSGFKNKIIESLAMNIPVITTKKGLTGSPFADRQQFETFESAEQQAEVILKLIDSGGLAEFTKIQSGNIKAEQSWSNVLKPLISYLNPKIL